MTLIVTATITSQWSLLLQQLFRHYATRYYSTYYATMILIATAYYVTMIPISGKRPPCTHSRDWRTPARCAIPGAARRTPRQTSKNMPFVLSYCFFLFCHLCHSISAGLKTISHEDAHLMYPRYSRVFLIVCQIYCPLPHPISVRTGWGYHCRVLVRLLAFLLN